MTFRVHELPRAQADIQQIVRWLFQRSMQGAWAWLDAYDELVARLQQHADSFGAAPEQHSEFDVRQALFKTRRGRVYRALFLLEGSDVYLLRVRGPGQASLQPDELA